MWVHRSRVESSKPEFVADVPLSDVKLKSTENNAGGKILKFCLRSQ